MATTVSSNFLPVVFPAEPFHADQKTLFETFTAQQIIDHVEKLIKQNNPSTLLTLTDIPENKFTWLHEVRDIEKAMCREEEIEEFFKKVTPFKLNFLIECLKIKDALEIPLLKAGNPGQPLQKNAPSKENKSLIVISSNEFIKFGTGQQGYIRT